MTILRNEKGKGAYRASGLTHVAAKQMARKIEGANCSTICEPYSAQPGTPCGCKCMMYCAGK